MDYNVSTIEDTTERNVTGIRPQNSLETSKQCFKKH